MYIILKCVISVLAINLPDISFRFCYNAKDLLHIISFATKWPFLRYFFQISRKTTNDLYIENYLFKDP